MKNSIVLCVIEWYFIFFTTISFLFKEYNYSILFGIIGFGTGILALIELYKEKRMMKNG